MLRLDASSWENSFKWHSASQLLKIKKIKNKNPQYVPAILQDYEDFPKEQAETKIFGLQTMISGRHYCITFEQDI